MVRAGGAGDSPRDQFGTLKGSRAPAMVRAGGAGDSPRDQFGTLKGSRARRDGTRRRSRRLPTRSVRDPERVPGPPRWYAPAEPATPLEPEELQNAGASQDRAQHAGQPPGPSTRAILRRHLARHSDHQSVERHMRPSLGEGRFRAFHERQQLSNLHRLALIHAPNRPRY